ncbi:hypothetical protein CLM62_21775 [Streptomyces sp. SA15]|uniref:DUF4232 domain-containing protein n=1 Tax=Streptomyces sp. SA15 TaxID=934019 RepID=UPI000BAF0035|nr:DUF4232 domain-containing protein [Streptomyces sp. SA15]PAZ14077.1 hypothetical protein CLM62_21775 [Streptomyces sp. SA15]
MSTRTHRTRLLVAAALTAATLTLTACGSGEGVHDEGASAGSASTSTATASATPSAKASGGTSTGKGQTDPAGSTSEGSAGGAAGSSGTSGSAGSSGSTGTSGSGTSGSTGVSGSTGSKDSASASVPCSSASTRMAATVVSRPLNHLLLTITNTGSKNCDLTGYPAVRFDQAQSVPPAFEDSKPQAVVTLAPGESGYASVLLSAADGSGSGGRTAKSLAVSFGASVARPSLPAQGVYVDDSIGVSYWQSTMADALAW